MAIFETDGSRIRPSSALTPPEANWRSIRYASVQQPESENGLSQRALADLLGVRQPRIVDLESGERNPRIETLIDISRKTGLEFAIDIAPASKTDRGSTHARR
jgi:DNA-binding XRE family transcriptional regulator